MIEENQWKSPMVLVTQDEQQEQHNFQIVNKEDCVVCNCLCDFVLIMLVGSVRHFRLVNNESLIIGR